MGGRANPLDSKPRAVSSPLLKGSERVVPGAGILRGQTQCPFLPCLRTSGLWASLPGSFPETREKPRGEESVLFPSLLLLTGCFSAARGDKDMISHLLSKQRGMTYCRTSH